PYAETYPRLFSVTPQGLLDPSTAWLRLLPRRVSRSTLRASPTVSSRSLYPRGDTGASAGPRKALPSPTSPSTGCETNPRQLIRQHPRAPSSRTASRLGSRSVLPRVSTILR